MPAVCCKINYHSKEINHFILSNSTWSIVDQALTTQCSSKPSINKTIINIIHISMNVKLPLLFLAKNLNSIFLSLLNCCKVSLYILAVSNLSFFRNIKKWSSFNFRESSPRIRNYLVTLSRCYVGQFDVFNVTKMSGVSPNWNYIAMWPYNAASLNYFFKVKILLRTATDLISFTAWKCSICR